MKITCKPDSFCTHHAHANIYIYAGEMFYTFIFKPEMISAGFLKYQNLAKCVNLLFKKQSRNLTAKIHRFVRIVARSNFWKFIRILKNSIVTASWYSKLFISKRPSFIFFARGLSQGPTFGHITNTAVHFSPTSISRQLTPPLKRVHILYKKIQQKYFESTKKFAKSSLEHGAHQDMRKVLQNLCDIFVQKFGQKAFKCPLKLSQNRVTLNFCLKFQLNVSGVPKIANALHCCCNFAYGQTTSCF